MLFTTELKSGFNHMLVRNKISFKIGWSNFMKTVKNPGAVVIDPGDVIHRWVRSCAGTIAVANLPFNKNSRS